MAGICERTPVPTGASSRSPARHAAHDQIATPATNHDVTAKTILERPWPTVQGGEANPQPPTRTRTRLRPGCVPEPAAKVFNA